MDNSVGVTGGPPRSGRGKRLPPATKAYIVAASLLLCIANLMLPIENGFPPFRVAGAPVRLPMVTAGLLAALLALRSPQKLARLFQRPFAAGQCVLIGLFLAESFLQGLGALGALSAAGMFTTFVLNYVLILDIFEKGGRAIFTKTLCIIASCAALVGIYEFISGEKLAVYAQLNELYWLSRNLPGGARGTTFDMRVTGTLGNPIVYATAMMLVLPFIADLRSHVLRFVMLVLVLFAAWSTLSLTTILLCGVFLAGHLVIGRAKVLRRSFVAALAAVSVVAIVGTSAIFTNEMASRWVSRFSEEQQMGESSGVTTRLSLVLSTFSASLEEGGLLSIVFGRGVLSSRELGLKLSAVLETVDNVYMSVLYENGVIGIVIYLAFWLWLLRRTSALALSSYHWYAVLCLLLAGMSFVTYVFYTINFVAVASIAVMSEQLRESRHVDRVRSAAQCATGQRVGAAREKGLPSNRPRPL